jgi:predicted TIM-barrel fold metal-dependent hydrolase
MLSSINIICLIADLDGGLDMIIDAHVHYAGDHPDALAQVAALDLKLVNVAVAHSSSDPWRCSAEVFAALADRHPDRYAWCTTFDPPDVAAMAGAEEALRYVEQTIRALSDDFAAGAIACKFWKNIGMELRKASGAFLMVDDPLFDPIYEYLASTGKPALMHIGEPLACWQPLNEQNPHAGYYGSHPEWYMGDKPEYPSHRDLIAARDRVLARHPVLRVIGAHLGSLEYDVAEVADRLDRFRNFAVDTSARLPDLMRQPHEKVRAFFLAHPDRILYGTDFVLRDSVSTLDEGARRAHLTALAERYARELAYFRVITAPGHIVQGLNLPDEVYQRITHGNALAWYPGL